MDEQETNDKGKALPPRHSRSKSAEALRWPALQACLAAWTVDGDITARPTLTLFFSGPHAVKAVLTDRRSGMQLWAVATSIWGLLDRLDDMLAEPEVPWEIPAAGSANQSLLRMLGIRGSRPEPKLLQ